MHALCMLQKSLPVSTRRLTHTAGPHAGDLPPRRPAPRDDPGMHPPHVVVQRLLRQELVRAELTRKHLKHKTQAFIYKLELEATQVSKS